MFDAELFIDGWSSDLDWRAELQSGKMTVENLLTQLKNLEQDMERQGCRSPNDDEDEDKYLVDWEAVADALEEQSA